MIGQVKRVEIHDSTLHKLQASIRLLLLLPPDPVFFGDIAGMA